MIVWPIEKKTNIRLEKKQKDKIWNSTKNPKSYTIIVNFKETELMYWSAV